MKKLRHCESLNTGKKHRQKYTQHTKTGSQIHRCKKNIQLSSEAKYTQTTKRV